MPIPANDNGKLLAVIAERVETIREDVAQIREDVRALPCGEHRKDIALAQADISGVKQALDKVSTRTWWVIGSVIASLVVTVVTRYIL